MMNYKVKPNKMMTSPSKMMEDKEEYPSVRIPVSKEMMKMMEMGMKVKVMLTGKIKSMRSDEMMEEMEMEFMEVSVDHMGSKKTMKDEIDDKLGYTKEDK